MGPYRESGGVVHPFVQELCALTREGEAAQRLKRAQDRDKRFEAAKEYVRDQAGRGRRKCILGLATNAMGGTRGLSRESADDLRARLLELGLNAVLAEVGEAMYNESGTFGVEVSW